MDETPDVLVVGDDDNAKKIAEAVQGALPNSNVVTGDHPIATASTQTKPEGPPKLPAVGTKFMVGGQEYEVVYINEGKRRFSSVPCTGMY